MAASPRRWTKIAATALGLSVLVAVTACSFGSPPQIEIQLATQGLDARATRDQDPGLAATRDAVAAFEQANPNIRVDLRVLSPTTDLALGQLSRYFDADLAMPDVATADVAWLATLVQNGWVLPLDGFRPRQSDFFSAQVEAATFGGRLYALPWFIDAEGVYYRTDLVGSLPTTPEELAAKAAAGRSAAVPYGVAFEGKQYEGLVTVFMDVLGGYGETINLRQLDTPAGENALQYMRGLVATGVAPPIVTSWQENDVRDAYVHGRAVFAVNWPYVYQAAEEDPTSAVRGRTGWMPFPAGSAAPRAALGGWDLVINARTRHREAAYLLVQYLVRSDVQVARAVQVGTPPAVRAAYRSTLYDRAPWFRTERPVFDAATPRLTDPRYPEASAALQQQLELALIGKISPRDALTTAQQQVAAVLAGPPPPPLGTR